MSTVISFKKTYCGVTLRRQDSCYEMNPFLKELEMSRDEISTSGGARVIGGSFSTAAKRESVLKLWGGVARTNDVKKASNVF